MKIILKCAFWFLVLFLTSCSKPQSNRNITELNSIIVNTLSSSKNIKSSSISKRFVNDLLEAHVKVENFSHNRYNDIEYCFKWYDRFGYEVSEDLSIWKTLFLDELDVRNIRGLAPIPKVEKFRFYLREKKESSIVQVNPKSIQDTDLYYGVEELYAFTEGMATGMLQSEIFDGTKVIDIREIENRTDEHIDTKSIGDSIRVAISKSGRAKFIDYQNYKKYIKKISGSTLSPDYILNGSIISVQKRDNHFYRITLNLYNLKNGLISWTDEKDIRKRSLQ